MKSNLRLNLFVSILLLVTGTGFLSACTALSGESTSQLDSRITKLENELQDDGEAIAKLQQQLQEQQQRVDALAPASPSTVVPATPPASTVPATPPSSVIPTALITFGKLTVTPAEVKLGEVVTISIEVSNNSTIEGSYNVAMVEKAVPAANTNVLEYANLVTLKPGETKTVTFTTTKSVAGAYSVEVGNKSGGYTVIDPSAPPPSSE